MSENCFSTYNTPKFQHGYEFFPQLQVKKNPHFGKIIEGDNDEEMMKLPANNTNPTASADALGGRKRPQLD